MRSEPIEHTPLRPLWEELMPVDQLDDYIVRAVLRQARPHYDCIVGNVVAGAGWLGIDLDPILGGVLSLEPRRTAAGWDLSLSSQRQLEAASAGTGLRLTFEPTRRLPTEGQVSVLVGDGGQMPWTPYWQRQSLEHSFLVAPAGDGFIAFDTYDTITEHGPASPVQVTDDWTTVEVARSIVLDLPPHSPHRRGTGPQPFLGPEPERQAYLAAVRDAEITLDQLSVDTWLLARAREVNLRFAETLRPDLVDRVRGSRDAWTTATESVYLALRRERRGRPVPGAYVEALEASFSADESLASTWERVA